jgi:hypothetical protein
MELGRGNCTARRLTASGIDCKCITRMIQFLRGEILRHTVPHLAGQGADFCKLVRFNACLSVLLVLSGSWSIAGRATETTEVLPQISVLPIEVGRLRAGEKIVLNFGIETRRSKERVLWLLTPTPTTFTAIEPDGYLQAMEYLDRELDPAMKQENKLDHRLIETYLKIREISTDHPEQILGQVQQKIDRITWTWIGKKWVSPIQLQIVLHDNPYGGDLPCQKQWLTFHSKLAVYPDGRFYRGQSRLGECGRRDGSLEVDPDAGIQKLTEAVSNMYSTMF